MKYKCLQNINIIILIYILDIIRNSNSCDIEY